MSNNASGRPRFGSSYRDQPENGSLARIRNWRALRNADSDAAATGMRSQGHEMHTAGDHRRLHLLRQPEDEDRARAQTPGPMPLNTARDTDPTVAVAVSDVDSNARFRGRNLVRGQVRQGKCNYHLS